MKPIVVKIGGSTLGSIDTTLEDLVTLQKRGVPIVVVHGGGKTTTEWLSRLNIPTKFAQGLRVTDADSLSVVIAVLAGLVNKELVSAIRRLGGKAAGISGVDGNLLQAEMMPPEYGYVGEKLKADTHIIEVLLKENYMPVIAPVSLAMKPNDKNINILNVNGDTAAAEIAASLNAEKLVFLTDVPGILDSAKKLIPELRADELEGMVSSGTATGGMAAKVVACLSALRSVSMIRIIDGRTSHALLDEMSGKTEGTTIVR